MLPKVSSPDIEDMLPDSGTIIQNDPVRKMAVYKDEAGNVNKLSSICPHLGCHLQ
jgi:nitrite reductase/ring-hydroxylating ferredoxin subunit